MNPVFIIGSGGFGTSLAVLLDQCGIPVSLYSAFPQELEAIARDGENKKLLPGIPVPKTIKLTPNKEEARDFSLAVFAVPSGAVRPVAKSFAGVLAPDTVIVNVGKGFEPSTQKRLSVVLKEEFPQNPVVVLSGPSHAEEIALGVPTTVVAASEDHNAALLVQQSLMQKNLRIYLNDDVLGVELGGALKNIIALAAGILDGMKIGDNARAALMTRGLAEITRLGTAMGAQAATFLGLAGMGDLIVTCTSVHSRNHRAGEYIGQGLSPKEAVEKVGMTVEGISATLCAHELAMGYRVEMPIVEQLYQVLQGNCDATTAIANLMGRPGRAERDRPWGST